MSNQNEPILRVSDILWSFFDEHNPENFDGKGLAEYDAIQAILRYYDERYIGDGELHYSHVCDPNNINCARFDARCQLKNEQRAKLIEDGYSK